MRCAVITPVGPGHEQLFLDCKASVEGAIAYGTGPFDEVVLLAMDDTRARHGRSRRRNEAIRAAQDRGIEWLFFLDADDLMNQSAFVDFGRHMDGLDAVFGIIVENVFGEDTIKVREQQPHRIESFEKLLMTDPALSIQMGHFVRTECAAGIGFDEAMDCGEDFKYYLELWERHRCRKVEEIFFINRRGRHSTGPRSADGRMWREAATAQIRRHVEKPGRELWADVEHGGASARFLVRDVLDRVQRNHAHGMFFDADALDAVRRTVGTGKRIVDVGANVGNHLVFFGLLMAPARLYPVEPNPGSLAVLDRNIEANGLGGLVDRRGMGVGVGAAGGRFAVEQPDPLNLGSARLVASPGGGVEVRTLDDLLGDDRADFVKIDAEGMELDVLAGAARTVARDRPTILAEVANPNVLAFLAWCADNGYRVAEVFANRFSQDFLVEPV